jgi:rSAM/selenodomain-associated transferase 1
MSGSGAIIVFLREPVPGKVKTRLAASIGADQATAVYRRLTALTLAAAANVDVPVYLRYDGHLPAPTDRAPRFFYAHQSPGDLGARMLHALAAAQSIHGRAILVGSDSPEITGAILHDALQKLYAADVVIGPATDGGYYLIGIAGTPDPRLFSSMPWSTDRVFALTIARCIDAGLKVAVMPMLSDVDTLEDLLRYPALIPYTTG